jgi:hypothetical protein
MSYPVILEQFDGAAPLRSLALERSALPEGEFIRRLGLRLERADYPGGETPTLQMMGFEEKPVRLAGLFTDREERVDGFADAARAALEGLWKDGRRLRLIYRTVSLIGTGGPRRLGPGERGSAGAGGGGGGV